MSWIGRIHNTTHCASTISVRSRATYPLETSRIGALYVCLDIFVHFSWYLIPYCVLRYISNIHYVTRNMAWLRLPANCQHRFHRTLKNTPSTGYKRFRSLNGNYLVQLKHCIEHVRSTYYLTDTTRWVTTWRFLPRQHRIQCDSTNMPLRISSVPLTSLICLYV